jgi:hypothetical protein
MAVETLRATSLQYKPPPKKSSNTREKYLKQGASLADLYCENLGLLFSDLDTAHKELDAIVLGLYGLNPDATEAEMVGKLFEMIG